MRSCGEVETHWKARAEDEERFQKMKEEAWRLCGDSLVPEFASASAEGCMSPVNTWSRCRYDAGRGVDSSHHVRRLCRASAHRNSSAQLTGCSAIDVGPFR